MQVNGEIKVGSIGTVYQVPIHDDDLVTATFNPSDADIKKLYFRMPKLGGGHEVLERTAGATTVTIEGVDQWCLTYTVIPADATTFHVAPGLMSVEGYIEYTDGRKWRSSRIDTDHQGRPLRIHPNLA